jgi:hypothetical protein
MLAFGQVGSGKTHTMFGSPTDPGLVPRILEAVRARVAKNRVAAAMSAESKPAAVAATAAVASTGDGGEPAMAAAGSSSTAAGTDGAGPALPIEQRLEASFVEIHKDKCFDLLINHAPPESKSGWGERKGKGKKEHRPVCKVRG